MGLLTMLRPGRTRREASAPPARTLAGDRQTEWAYVAARIGRYADAGTRVLDFGCGNGMLTFAAAQLGAQVLAIDLLPQEFPAALPNVEFRQFDLLDLPDTTGPFELILNCSTVEHVGLAGRYAAPDLPDGDLAAMCKLRALLAPGGHVLMTLPIGVDAVVAPLHRIYGAQRLPRLLDGFRVVEESYWRKPTAVGPVSNRSSVEPVSNWSSVEPVSNRSSAAGPVSNRSRVDIWQPCSKSAALNEIGGAGYYALGGLVLQRE